MTLKEKLKPTTSISTEGEARRFADKSVIVAEEFAIEFAEWVCDCEYNIQWFKDQNKTDELLEMYKETL